MRDLNDGHTDLVAVAARRALHLGMDVEALALLSALDGRQGRHLRATETSLNLVRRLKVPRPGARIAIVAALGSGWFDVTAEGELTLEIGHNNIAAVLSEMGCDTGTIWAERIGEEAVDAFLRHADIAVFSVSDPDTADLSMLEAAEVRIRTLEVPIVNAPTAISRSSRPEIAEIAAAVPGVVAPVTTRVATGQLDGWLQARSGQPGRLLCRPVGRHNGVDVKLARVDELLRDLPRHDRGQEYYLTEYVDTRFHDGLRRKARLYSVFGKLFAEHCLIGDAEILHSQNGRAFMFANPKYFAEEFEFVGHWRERYAALDPLMQAIAGSTGLDVFMADVGLLEEGGVVLFEANAAARIILGHEGDSEGEQIVAVTHALRLAVRDGILARARSAVNS